MEPRERFVDRTPGALFKCQALGVNGSEPVSCATGMKPGASDIAFHLNISWSGMEDENTSAAQRSDQALRGTTLRGLLALGLAIVLQGGPVIASPIAASGAASEVRPSSR